jgi:hypothetical protein
MHQVPAHLIAPGMPGLLSSVQRTRHPIASLNPLVWLDPSDISTLYQDAAATTSVTAHNDPVGAIRNKGTAGGYWTQSTAGARPLFLDETGLRSLFFDGTDDHLLSSVSVAALTDAMLCCAIRTTDTMWMLLSNGGVNTPWIGVAQNGNTGAISTGGGQGYVNKAAISPNDRDGLHDAITGATPRVLTIADTLNLTGATTPSLSGYTLSSYGILGRVYGLVIMARPSAEARAVAETWMGTKAGIAI